MSPRSSFLLSPGPRSLLPTSTLARIRIMSTHLSASWSADGLLSRVVKTLDGCGARAWRSDPRRPFLPTNCLASLPFSQDDECRPHFALDRHDPPRVATLICPCTRPPYEYGRGEDLPKNVHVSILQVLERPTSLHMVISFSSFMI